MAPLNQFKTAYLSGLAQFTSVTRLVATEGHLVAAPVRSFTVLPLSRSFTVAAQGRDYTVRN